MEKLSGKCVLLGVTGGIAAYKMASVASGLRKAGADVHVIMTENAAQFITPTTMQALSGRPVGSWQKPDLSFVWDVPWSVVGEGRDAAFTLAADAYTILVHHLPGTHLIGSGGGVFEAVESIDLPAQSATAQIQAQEIVQFDGAVRVTVSPHS